MLNRTNSSVLAATVVLCFVLFFMTSLSTKREWQVIRTSTYSLLPSESKDFLEKKCNHGPLMYDPSKSYIVETKTLTVYRRTSPFTFTSKTDTTGQLCMTAPKD